VIANGDIRSPEDARRVLEATGADGVMIGRAAQGRPWFFREVAHYLATGERLSPPPAREIGAVLDEHLEGLYSLYGAEQGARVARKHIAWTVRALPGGEALRRSVNALHAAEAQRAAVNDYFERLAA
jgi:tRNA-dihydrouridine synthase B